MKIHSIRLGHATNSSSSHSIIILPPGTEAVYDDLEGGSAWQEYGWDQFTLRTADAKLDYLAVLLRYSLGSLNLPDGQRAAIEEAWVGHVPPPDAYIDHRSLFTFPRAWGEPGVDRAFFEAFKAALLREDVVVLGGNDNGGSHWLAGRGTPLIPSQHDLSGACVARQDPAGYWTLFNRASGAKFRITLGDDPCVPTSAYAPELVDLKITDGCPYACTFCYQGSVPNGQHAALADVQRIATAFGELRIFEVALGGGEPTLHPQFTEIVEAFHRAGTVVNFTTRNPAWYRMHPKVLSRMSEEGGKFAFSTERVAALQALEADQDWPFRRMDVQVTLGVVTMEELERIMDWCVEHHTTLTLLAFKHTGRGAGYAPLDSHGWLELVQRRQRKGTTPRLGIDTPLAADYHNALTVMGVPRYLYEIKEGKFSLYIDAVSGQCGASSYGDLPLDPLPLTGSVAETLVEHMATYAGRAQ